MYSSEKDRRNDRLLVDGTEAIAVFVPSVCGNSNPGMAFPLAEMAEGQRGVWLSRDNLRAFLVGSEVDGASCDSGERIGCSRLRLLIRCW